MRLYEIVSSDPMPWATNDYIAAEFLEHASGSNEGGVYLGEDGVERYVKYYSDPNQSYAEAVTNRIYSHLGFMAPRSTLVYEGDDIVGVANDMIPNITTFGSIGANRITKNMANAVLDGFAVDVLTSNWDAVGLELDNIAVVVQGGKQTVARIDQGGSLIYRAMGGLKSDIPGIDINNIDEWTSMIEKNYHYGNMFDIAGIQDADALGKRVVEQISAIDDLAKRTNQFRDIVPMMPGVDTNKRNAMLSMLQSRMVQLRGKANDINKSMAKPHPADKTDYPGVRVWNSIKPVAGDNTEIIGKWKLPVSKDRDQEFMLLAIDSAESDMHYQLVSDEQNTRIEKKGLLWNAVSDDPDMDEYANSASPMNDPFSLALHIVEFWYDNESGEYD